MCLSALMNYLPAWTWRTRRPPPLIEKDDARAPRRVSLLSGTVATLIFVVFKSR